MWPFWPLVVYCFSEIKPYQVSSYTGIAFSSDLLHRFSKSQFLALYKAQRISLHWKRDNFYIELMTCCQQRVFFTSPLKALKGIQRNLTGSKISTSSTNFVFFGPIRKKDGSLDLWLAEFFFTSLQKPLNWIQTNLTGSKVSTSFTNFVFFGPIEKKEDGRPASDWLRDFQLFLWNHWMEFNLTWQKTRL